MSTLYIAAVKTSSVDNKEAVFEHLASAGFALAGTQYQMHDADTPQLNFAFTNRDGMVWEGSEEDLLGVDLPAEVEGFIPTFVVAFPSTNDPADDVKFITALGHRVAQIGQVVIGNPELDAIYGFSSEPGTNLRIISAETPSTEQSSAHDISL